jgi:predicted GNAT superfamily acetyltransferase
MSRRISAQFIVWFREKYREQAEISGVYVAARNLRKQGVPLEYAVSILASRGQS